MIEIDEALRLIHEHAATNPTVEASFAEAVGRVIAKPIVSDISTPPFDRSLMDGYALRAADVEAAETRLPISNSIAAGDAIPAPLAAGTAAKIMTGAPLPAGADAVVAREKTTEDTSSVLIQQYPVSSEMNLMRAGTICQAGDTVISVGSRVSAAVLGVLAETGHGTIPVVPAATVAVLATGSELVPVGQPLKPGQIRNSNGPMLTSMASVLGNRVTDLGIAGDDRALLKAKIEEGLDHNVLLLSGGVSAGDFDFVPSVLQECGVTEIFHKVKLKPGKPIWFGKSANGTLVFGLPGNPVSSLVCFRLFVQPALQRIGGDAAEPDQLQVAVLQSKYRQNGERTTYFPARFYPTNKLEPRGKSTTPVQLEVLPWHGSSDLHTFTRANCLAVFPANRKEFDVGEEIEYLPLSP